MVPQPAPSYPRPLPASFAPSLPWHRGVRHPKSSLGSQAWGDGRGKRGAHLPFPFPAGTRALVALTANLEARTESVSQLFGRRRRQKKSGKKKKKRRRGNQGALPATLQLLAPTCSPAPNIRSASSSIRGDHRPSWGHLLATTVVVTG